MSVRVKLQVYEIAHLSYSETCRRIKLRTVYDSTIPEDQRFYDATPNGTFEMLVNNPAALEQLKMGQAFYLDMTPVPDAVETEV